VADRDDRRTADRVLRGSQYYHGGVELPITSLARI
jgi:hypothetical protein